MTKNELDEIARRFISAVNRYRQENPDEVTSVIGVGVTAGQHPDDVGWWILSCSKMSAVPFEPGSEEWRKAGYGETAA